MGPRPSVQAGTVGGVFDQGMLPGAQAADVRVGIVHDLEDGQGRVHADAPFPDDALVGHLRKRRRLLCRLSRTAPPVRSEEREVRGYAVHERDFHAVHAVPIARCLSGRRQTKKYSHLGYSHMTGGYSGGQAEYVRVPMADVGPMVVPASMSDEEVLFLSGPRCKLGVEAMVGEHHVPAR
jgi:hypothetical protein